MKLNIIDEWDIKCPPPFSQEKSDQSQQGSRITKNSKIQKRAEPKAKWWNPLRLRQELEAINEGNIISENDP